MPHFAYKAVTHAGDDIAGELEAIDRTAALRELLARGVSVIEIGATSHRLAPLFRMGTAQFSARVRPRQLSVLTRQLATSLEAGLPLMTALDVVGRELEQASLRQVLSDLASRVQQGISLSEALSAHPTVFEPMYVRLVRVGETGGMLDTVLAQLADMLERRTELQERVKTAAIYPALVLLLGIASVTIIVVFIVPRIIASLDVEHFLLPWPTRVLMGMSDLVAAYWWLLLGLALTAGIGWRQLILRGPGRPWWDQLKLRVPILGRLIRQLESARFARNLGLLAHGGISITEALAVVCDTIQNATIRGAVHHLAESIQSGEPLATPLHRTGLFPPLLVQMVRVGESTGRLDEMLLRSAAVHESQAKVTLERLVSMLPVLLILALACVIGFIVAGLVLAIVEFQTTGVGVMTH